MTVDDMSDPELDRSLDDWPHRGGTQVRPAPSGMESGIGRATSGIEHADRLEKAGGPHDAVAARDIEAAESGA
jgi:hypothetical protein